MGQVVSTGLANSVQRSKKSIGIAKQSNVNDSCSSWADDLLSDLDLEVDRASRRTKDSDSGSCEHVDNIDDAASSSWIDLDDEDDHDFIENDVKIDNDASSSWIDLSDEEDDTIEQIVDDYSKMSASTLQHTSTEPAQEDSTSAKLMVSISDSTLEVEESIEALAQQMDAILSYYEMDSNAIRNTTQETQNIEKPTLFSRLEKIARIQQQIMERIQTLTDERENWKTFALRRGKILDKSRQLKSSDTLDSNVGRRTQPTTDNDIHNCQVFEVARLHVQVRRLETENRAVMRDRSEAFEKLKEMLNGVQNLVEEV